MGDVFEPGRELADALDCLLDGLRELPSRGLPCLGGVADGLRCMHKCFH